MDLGLKGRKVILTGGSRGIGRRALELFAEEGCDVAFFSRNADQVAETKAALEKHGGKVVASTFDLNEMDLYQDWLRKAADELGGCDIFIPGASASGSQVTGDWDKCFQFDLMGAVRGCEALEPFLEASAHGSVVFMSSTAGVETFLVPQAFNAILGRHGDLKAFASTACRRGPSPFPAAIGRRSRPVCPSSTMRRSRNSRSAGSANRTMSPKR